MISILSLKKPLVWKSLLVFPHPGSQPMLGMKHKPLSIENEKILSHSFFGAIWGNLSEVKKNCLRT